MTFNDNARIDTSGITRRGGGRTGAAVGGGSVIVMIIGALIYMFTGVDISGLTGGGSTGSETQSQGVENCQTGADANANVDCRMAGVQNSLDQYWTQEGPNLGISYSTPTFVLYSGQTQSACGTASNAVGPFYCPGDKSMYIDTSFFDLLESQFGSKDGPMAEMYIVAHEWGHAIQDQAGILQQVDNSATGPTSDAVRLELQADCLAGAWSGHASEATDASGTRLIQPLTDADIQNALGAAAAVGDDHIQQSQTGRVQPEAFTHGTSEQRVRWFTTGYKSGWQSCDTFGVSGNQL